MSVRLCPLPQLLPPHYASRLCLFRAACLPGEDPAQPGNRFPHIEQSYKETPVIANKIILFQITLRHDAILLAVM